MPAATIPLFPELTPVLDNVTALDFETTGLSASKGRVIEMAALKSSGGKVVTQFQTMVKLKGKIPAKTTQLTGIRQEDVRQGMEERTAFLILQELIGDSVVVMHNAPYDLAFLYSAYQRLSLPPVQHPFLDTLSVCRLRQPSPRSLPDMCRAYGIEHTRWHRALPDTTATWKLLHRLHEESPVDPLLNKIVVNPQYGWPKWLPPLAEILLPPDTSASERGQAPVA
ncbi:MULTISPECIES: 3'-5' exonuclease [Rufibacter]|uniref:DNA polymerase III alpha subunit (Gram-positive type) n=1 Tax=Rufibacter quisquiliarum TaxID=1549639 RepID=A0A839GN74_9BACT|nr:MULTISPECIES: 3'-5' exonuclease [Rufibacter]MBA9079373.1 DNA polymerase III alpha subunit (gram-positive type) [Rufibacter quisquiliarum]